MVNRVNRKEAGWWNEKGSAGKYSKEEFIKESKKKKKNKYWKSSMRQRDVAKAKEKASSTLFEWLDTKEKIKTCIQPLKWLTYTNRVCWADRRSVLRS